MPHEDPTLTRHGDARPSSTSVDEGRFPPGTLLAQRYRIVSQLGRGGMGEVYRANDLLLGQPVALKFLPARLAQDETALARLRNECRLARQVSHPNVCRVYDLGEFNGQIFLTMEFVDGEDLGSLLRRIGRLPAEKAVDIARQLCAGLAAAHDQGILHRDLKPGNVMLDGRGRVRVTDFGLAALTGAVDDVRSGTPAYMAPEQRQGLEVTTRSDIYSLGMLLHEVYTGALPSEAQTAELDPAVDRVLQRCLATDPARRPPSPLAVAASLPGGDPLAAALAAGETPSPALVAAAGGTGVVKPAVAWGCCAAIAAGLLALAWLKPLSQPLHHARTPFPPDVLAQKARDLAARLGYPEAPSAEAWGFYYEISSLDAMARRHGDALWSEIQRGRTPLRFWYRATPSGAIHAPDIAQDFFGFRAEVAMRVKPRSPVVYQPRSYLIVTDPEGRLREFQAAPRDPASASAPHAPDWPRILRETGFDPATLKPTDARRDPASLTDSRAAWRGARHGEEFVVEAAVRGDRLVFLDTRPASGTAAPQIVSAYWDGLAGTRLAAILAILFGSAFFLCWANVRGRRFDRVGAPRFTVALLLLYLTANLLYSSLGPGVVFQRIVVSVEVAMFGAAFSLASYCALEPYARRYWPELLIGWSRLMEGRWRDPLVARDVLAGITVGIVNSLLMTALSAYDPFNVIARSMVYLDVLLGGRFVAATFVGVVANCMYRSLNHLLLIVSFKLLLRNSWLAAIATSVLLCLLFPFDSPRFPGNLLLMLIVVLLISVAFIRFGLVALLTAYTTRYLMASVPFTTDTRAWYFGVGLTMPALILAVAWLAARVSSAQPAQKTSSTVAA